MNNEYMEFLKENFPSSYQANSIEGNIIYSRVCENNIMCDMFDIHINNEASQYFLRRYREQFNKLILACAINEKSCIDYFMRSAIEYSLKMIYAFLKSNIEIAKINTIAYRNLNKELKGDERLFNNVSLGELFSLYGMFSNCVHGELNSSNDILYIKNIISTKQFNFQKLDSEILRLLNNFQKICALLLKIDSSYLSTPTRIRLNKIVSNKRVDAIYKNLQ